MIAYFMILLTSMLIIDVYSFAVINGSIVPIIVFNIPVIINMISSFLYFRKYLNIFLLFFSSFTTLFANIITLLGEIL